MAFKLSFSLLFIIFGVGGSLQFMFQSRRGGSLGRPMRSSVGEPSEEWFNQTLDHFNPQDTRTWKQRFYRNTTFYEPHGPVFLLVDGEGESTADWSMEGAWIEYAQTHHALCFQLEHRFYGKSRPTKDLSVASLKYLSSEQALADIAQFITVMNEELGIEPSWVLFGGSYPGSLVAWARTRYPHLVHAAVSTSGPLLALLDFQEYFEVVIQSINRTSAGCLSSLAKAQKQLDLMLKQQSGRDLVTTLFKLCTPYDGSNIDDIYSFNEAIASNIADIVQYNEDNKRSESGGKKITINAACSILEDKKLGIAVFRLANLSNLLLDRQNMSCLPHSYNETIGSLINETWTDDGSGAVRQWTYQTCTEFGFFQTSTRPEVAELFGMFPLSLFEKQCSDAFGPEFSTDLLSRGIARTNAEYGALSYSADRVVFVHGSIDPWHALGITHSLGLNTPALYIQGVAHCATMYPSSPSDPPQLTSARITISKLLMDWLKLNSTLPG